LTGFVNAITA